MRPSPFRQFDTATLLRDDRAELRKAASEHRPAHRASREAVQPVVVVVFRLQFPFIHRAATARSLHAIFRGQVLGEELVNAGNTSVEREGAMVTCRNREASVNEMSNGTL